MDATGVDRQVISLNPILFRYYLEPGDAIECSKAVNDEIAGIVADHPDRFAGFGTLPMQDLAAAVGELERVMSTAGMVGVSVGTHVGGLNWDEPDLFPVLEAAEQANALVFVHPAASRLKEALPRYHMRNFIANPTETTIAIGSLIFGGILDRLPGLRLLFAHGGGYACWAYARFDHGHQVRAEAREHIVQASLRLSDHPVVRLAGPRVRQSAPAGRRRRGRSSGAGDRLPGRYGPARSRWRGSRAAICPTRRRTRCSVRMQKGCSDGEGPVNRNCHAGWRRQAS